MFVSFSCNENRHAPVAENDVTQYLGQWTIYIAPRQVGWLEVRQEEGYIDGDLLWIGGSIMPVPYVFVSDNKLIIGRGNARVVRKKDEEGAEGRTHNFPTWLEFKREGNKITGYYLRPDRSGTGLDSSALTGTLLPDVPPPPDLTKARYGEPVQLFNGKDLSGWRMVEENRTNGWSVVDGALVNDPGERREGEASVYGNIRTEQEFEDFNIKLEVNIPERSNSGVYLRGIYEIQVVDSYGRSLDSHNMGGLYSRVTPVVSAEKPAGQWQSMDITLCDRHVTVILNGQKIIDNQPAYGPTGGALSPDVFAPGPIYLQGDHGKVSYRNIVLTPVIK